MESLGPWCYPIAVELRCSSRIAVPLALMLLLGACTPDAPTEGDPPGGGPAPARVAVGQVSSGGVDAEWSFLGEVEALRHASLGAGADGEVRSVKVRAGDRVERGALLVEVDPSLAAARLREAEAATEAGAAEAEQAERDAERLRGAGPDVFSPAEIERAAAEMDRARAETVRRRAAAGEARVQLGRHRVKAPFAGMVARRLVDPGDWVQAGTPVIELIDPEHVEVIVSVPPEVAQYLEADAPVRLEHAEDGVDASVRVVVRALDEESRTVRVRVLPKEPAVWLLPGSAIDARFSIRREEEGALVVPRDALVYGIADVYVMKVVDGEAVRVPVQIVARGADRVLVRAEALSEGDSLVTRGNERLRPGQALTIIPES